MAGEAGLSLKVRAGWPNHKPFTGIVSRRPPFIARGDVAGTEDITPDDTFDRDYGRMLERAHDRICRNGLASPMPASWNQIASWLQQIDRLRCAA
jgi:hypothetical protein